MALAWNAGWVNSPRGFKSRILRTRSGVRPVDRNGLVAPGPTSNEEVDGPHRCGGLARVVLYRRRCPLLLLHVAALARTARRNLPHPGPGAAHRHGRADRPRRAAGGVHTAADPPTRVRHTAAGLDDADIVDRPARIGRCAD